MIRIFLFCLLFVISFLFFTRSVAAAPPENFQKNLIVGSGLEGPSGFEFAPDGRVFVLERTGKIKIVKNGVLLPTPFAELPSVATGDRGLIGIAFDPDFTNNPYVYFYYTSADDLLNRLVRFNASGDVGTEGPYILFETKSRSEQLHVGGSINFGPDGKLYFAVGDNGYPPNSQNLTNPHGKILRINKDGSIPTDNPFYNEPGLVREIWAYGFRNPWRFQFDSATGKMYGGDVGDFSVEEINHIVKGGNYGWSVCEGACNNPNFIDPIYSWNHEGNSAASTGGPIYRGTMFPPEYQGNFFFGDYAMSFIKRCVLDINGNCSQVLDFDNAAGSVVDMKVSPIDGSFWYLTYIPGRIYQVTYSTGNHFPVPNSAADVTKGSDPLTVNFSSAGSTDPEGDQLFYSWTFGDGTTSTSANPQKTYTQKGTYEVNLSVSDGTNTSNAVPIIIQVGQPPIVTIATPNEGDTYRAGDTITYQAFAIDGAGFDINDAAIKTDIIFHHDTHIHPFIDDLIGRNNSFTIPTTGETSPNTWYEIQVSVTDSSGLTTKLSRNIYPVKSSITVNSNVPGLTFLLDGVPTLTNSTIQGVSGFVREISAPATQILNGVVYAFESWSNGADPRQNVSFKDMAQTLIANFQPVSAYQAEYFDNINLTGTPKFVTNVSNIDFFWDMGSPDPSIPVDNFSARYKKTQYFARGNYKFTTTSDDGVRVFIDGIPVINKWQDMGSEVHSGEVLLEAGDHEIVVEYYEHGGGAVLKFNWELAAVQPTPTPTATPTPTPAAGFNAQYFNNQTLSGSPTLIRVESEINNVWNDGSPAASIPVNNFSARWTKSETFEAGNYEFTLIGDDGIRLFIDNEQVIDGWKDQPMTTYKVTKALTAGTHEIKVEYYENGGGAIAQFSYNKTSAPTQSPSVSPTPAPNDFYKGEYWNNQGQAEQPVFLTTPPDLTRNDQEINFVWDNAAPAASINPDKYLARWTKSQIFEAGNYKFITESDDGIRVYINNEIVIDQWNDHPMTTHEGTKSLTAGTHEIKVEFYENAGGAIAKFKFEKTDGPVPTPSPTPTPTPTTGWLGEYFDNQNLEGSPKLSRTDDLINFIWEFDAPSPEIPANHFSVRWTKVKNYAAGAYNFTLKSDDGIRFYIDGNLIVDDWTNHAMKIYTPTVVLTAGAHTIRVEYFDNDNNAIAIVEEN